MTSRVVNRTVIGRADLARIAVVLADAGLDVEKGLAAAAIALGYERSPESPLEALPAPPDGLMTSRSGDVATPLLPDLAEVEAIPFWQPHSFVWHSDDVRRDVVTAMLPLDADTVADARAVAEMKGTQPPKPALLSPRRRLVPMLQRALTMELDGRDLDIPSLIRSWTRGAHLRRLPRLPRRIWPASMVLVDRSSYLVPFWHDQDALLDTLTGELGASGFVVRVVEDGDFGEVQLGGLPVLALTDLGWYGGPRLRRSWLRLGRQLRRAGGQLHALVPVPKARWTPALERLWGPMAWERPGSAEPGADEREARASQLLDLAATARRLEPGLLRSLRLLLPRSEADVGTEADAWMHDDVASMCPGATILRPERATARQEAFAGMAPELRAQVADTFRSWHWHRGRRPELWHMEALGFAGRDHLSPAELGRAERFMLGLGRRAMAQRADPASAEMVRRWLDYMSPQTHAGTWSSATPAGAGLQLAWWATHELDDPPPNPDPTLATIARGEQPPPTNVYAIRQVGEWLEVEPGLADGWSVQSGLLTSLWADSPRLFRVGLDIDRGPVSLDATAQFRVVPSSRLELRTDRSTVGLRALTLPAWASAIGRDPAGLWVEMTIHGVVSRMRWIPPGRFLMGSPGTEQGRWDDEGPQHEVVVSRGYWLGETPVTQALWQAVMDDNPSQFEGPTRPVEQVSWEDTQRFMAVLNEPIEPTDGDEGDGEHFRLPSEAEWEYACRAGTTGATHARWREAAPDAIAWWSGNSEGQTHPVRQKQPNAWGLHDMLGNVLEWCMDAWHSYSADSSVLVDPVITGSDGVHRVYRGGGWAHGAGFVRAAFRNAGPPDHRGGDLGFRLARGQGYQGPEGAPPGGR